MRKEWLESHGVSGKPKADQGKAKADALAAPSVDGGEDNLGDTTDSSDEGKAD